MRAVRLLTVAALVLLPVPAHADVQLTIRDGRVSLRATNATAREILAEWARVGQTTILNGERVPGGPMTIELVDMPEGRALDVILRAASGYVAAPRQADLANASRFDRILVLPTSAPAQPAPPPRPAVAQPGVPRPGPPVIFQPPPEVFQQPRPDDEPSGDVDEEPAPEVVMPPGGPIFNVYPPTGPVPRPGAAAAPAYPPGVVPGGVPVPGMVAPAPPQPAPQVVPVIPMPVEDPEDR
jgi:hypothetical protein